MPRAVLKNGVIVPIEPLPKEWTDGKEIIFEEAPAEPGQTLEEWYRELEKMCAENTDEDIDELEAALKRADDLAKEVVRQQMGLP